MYNDIAEDINKLRKLKPTESRKKMLPIFKQLEEIFMGSKANEDVDDEADDATDVETDEQLDTTDMPELETEESIEQKNQQGKELKILTSQQMLSRLPISLAQLKAGNNSQKLKNKIRQLLHLLYKSKKLSKTIYKHLMNAI